MSTSKHCPDISIYTSLVITPCKYAPSISIVTTCLLSEANTVDSRNNDSVLTVGDEFPATRFDPAYDRQRLVAP